VTVTLLVGAVVLGSILLRKPDAEPPVAGGAAAATTVSLEATSTTAVPSETAPAPTAPPASWYRVSAGAVDEIGMMNSVTVGGPGLVAVGWAQTGDDRDAAVWTSIDGTVWDRVPHDPEVFGGPRNQEMNAVAAGGPGLVAIGYDASPGAGSHAAVWVSADGLSWQRIPGGDAVFGGAQTVEMAGVVAGGPGLVAVGGLTSVGGYDAAVWTSSDGTVWQRLVHDVEVMGGQGSQVMADVVAFGERLVAVGADGPADAQHAAIWVSADSLVWERVPHRPEIFTEPGMTGGMAAVAVGGPGLVAVGHFDDGESGHGGHAAVWTSRDGVHWERIIDAGEEFGGRGAPKMVGVMGTASGLVAVGSTHEDVSTAAAWISPNGTSWHRMPHDTEAFGGADPDGPGKAMLMRSITATSDRMVAVGWEEGRPAVWLGPRPVGTG